MDREWNEESAGRHKTNPRALYPIALHSYSSAMDIGRKDNQRAGWADLGLACKTLTVIRPHTKLVHAKSTNYKLSSCNNGPNGQSITGERMEIED